MAVAVTTWVLGCDFSYSKPDLQQLWDAGYRVILGYLSDTPGKGMSQAYVDEALAIGFKIVPLYETTARAALGGHTAGVAQAGAAMRIGAALGMPAATTVIFALDSDYTTTEMATVVEFVAGLHSVAGSDGEYGGIDQLRYLLAHHIGDGGRLFQTYAWSDGEWLAAADAPIEQTRNGVDAYGGTIDICRVDIDNPSLTLWEPTMAGFDDGDAAHLLGYVDPFLGQSLHGLLKTTNDRTGAAANTQLPAIAATLAGIVKTEAAIQLALSSGATSGDAAALAGLAAQIKAIGDAESAAFAAQTQKLAALDSENQALKADLDATKAALAAALAK